MGRLIDADKLYESLIEDISWLKEQDYETYCAVGDTIRFVTDQQPTAYDQNKVVEQLEELKEEKMLGSHKVMLKEAIEIVKDGA